ncbi:thiamine biosynthesis protein thio [Pelistega indica]|uniref:Thiamine biosynthesis protein thio n=1 Tax=Pelistega indica TaxID=1414851 RepID=V8G7B7_9BURK|nr:MULTISPECIES: FAD-dependent oxidoreductase [Pelistega]ETD72315.1 thiamine biosynthesis protein thio [Pelistega indica]
MNIGIAGAGLAGRLCALLLSQQGHQVQVFDKASHPTDPVAAGFTAAGMLSHVAELESGDEHIYNLGVRSLELWKHIVPQLDAPVSLHYKGSLMVAHRGDEGAAQRLISLLERKAPVDQKPIKLTTEQLKAEEPSISGPAHAWALQNEGHIHTREAMYALYASCKNTLWHWQTPVQKLKANKIITDRETFTFDWVFDTRGVGARELKFANTHTLSCQNVRGVRGEILWLQAPALALQRPIRLLHPRYRVYLVPRQPDILFVGASEIESEDRSPISVRTTVELLTAAHSVLPELAEARIIHTETNLRPALIDNFPRIETAPGISRINGLFRHGWLIAPATVEQALKEVLGAEYTVI